MSLCLLLNLSLVMLELVRLLLIKKEKDLMVVNRAKKLWIILFSYLVVGTSLNIQANTEQISSFMPAAPVACSFIILSRLAAKQLGFKSSLAKYDPTVAVMKSLLMLTDKVQSFDLKEPSLSKQSFLLEQLVVVLLQAHELGIVPFDNYLKNFVVEKQDVSSLYEQLLNHVKHQNSFAFLHVFFEFLHQKVLADMRELIPELDAILKLERSSSKGLFGLFNVPQLPLPDDMQEHEASLLLALVETWNFIGLFMNNEDKARFLVEQIDLIFIYVREHIFNFLSPTNIQVTIDNDMHLSININV
jgi:hypothetical protein